MKVGSRIIRICATQENTVSTVSSVCEHPATQTAGDVCNEVRSIGEVPAAADDADGADANAGCLSA
jgi:hypothetical protein